MKRVRYVKPSDRNIIKEILASSRPQENKHASNYRAGNGAYDEKYPHIAKALCRRGATLAELAEAFNVSTQAIGNWLSKYPEFGEAVNEGAHDEFDPRVERSLAELALGYSVDVVEWFVIDKELVSRVVRKHYPPNVTACIFWLKNRQKERWRDVQNHEVSQVGLRSADDIRQALILEFKDLVDKGVLQIPDLRPKMKEINPKANGHGDSDG